MRSYWSVYSSLIIKYLVSSTQRSSTMTHYITCKTSVTSTAVFSQLKVKYEPEKSVMIMSRWSKYRRWSKSVLRNTTRKQMCAYITETWYTEKVKELAGSAANRAANTHASELLEKSAGCCVICAPHFGRRYCSAAVRIRHETKAGRGRRALNSADKAHASPGVFELLVCLLSRSLGINTRGDRNDIFLDLFYTMVSWPLQCQPGWIPSDPL